MGFWKYVLGTPRNYALTIISIWNDINLDINRGEKVAIMGESGSGKSTLVKVMFGILKASTGEIQHKRSGNARSM